MVLFLNFQLSKTRLDIIPKILFLEHYIYIILIHPERLTNPIHNTFKILFIEVHILLS